MWGAYGFLVKFVPFVVAIICHPGRFNTVPTQIRVVTTQSEQLFAPGLQTKKKHKKTKKKKKNTHTHTHSLTEGCSLASLMSP
jgi:ferric iron reductase protein FhuF